MQNSIFTVLLLNLIDPEQHLHRTNTRKHTQFEYDLLIVNFPFNMLRVVADMVEN